MEEVIQNVGGSYHIMIPARWIKQKHLGVGSMLEVREIDNGFLVTIPKKTEASA